MKTLHIREFRVFGSLFPSFSPLAATVGPHQGNPDPWFAVRKQHDLRAIATWPLAPLKTRTHISLPHQAG